MACYFVVANEKLTFVLSMAFMMKKSHTLQLSVFFFLSSAILDPRVGRFMDKSRPTPLFVCIPVHVVVWEIKVVDSLVFPLRSKEVM